MNAALAVPFRIPRLPLARRLSFKQTRAAVIVAIGVGGLLALWQIWADIQRERARVAESGEIVSEVIQGPAARATYRLDDVAAAELLSGLLKSEGLVRAEIIDDFGDTLAVAERPPRFDSVPWFATLIGTETIVTERLLSVPPLGLTVGSLVVHVDPREAAMDFNARVSSIIVSGLLRSLVLSLLLLAAFHWLITTRVYAAIEPLSDTVRDVVTPEGGDELDQLIATNKRALERLQHMAEKAATDKERMLLAAESAGFGIWECNIGSGEKILDERTRALFGLGSKTTLSAQRWFEHVHPEDKERAEQDLRRASEGGQNLDTELRILHPDRSVRIARLSATALGAPSGRPSRLVGVSIDLSESRALQEQLVQSQRVDAIGRLTGGIAHDFNNLLAVVLGNLELLSESPLAEDDRELLSDSLHVTKRGASLTRQLLAFGRRYQLSPQVLNLNAVVQSMDSLLRRTIPESIEIDITLSAGLRNTWIDAPQLEAAILNLVLNARDAMGQGGRLTIETANVSIGHEYIESRREDIPVGRYVLLAVTDTGAGMASEVLDRAIEPFFTTKAIGIGTGMGLSMVHGFVKQSNGAIRLYSELGVGTTVKLYFPVTSDQKVEAPEKPVLEQPKHADTILLVEDDADVRHTIQRVLQRLGYTVLQAESGPKALKKLRDNPQISLVLSDIVMPEGMQGTDLAKKLREMHTDLPIVLMSGYPREAAINGNGVHPNDFQLMKPVEISELSAVLRRALEK